MMAHGVLFVSRHQATRKRAAKGIVGIACDSGKKKKKKNQWQRKQAEAMKK